MDRSEADTQHQLFFLDSGDPANPPNSSYTFSSDNEETSLEGDKSAAWVDSDDERVVVSLATNTRLRKLRTSELEDVINGKEYVRRLRRQYQRLHPSPQWADPSASKKRRKVGNGTLDSFNIDSEDGSSNSADELEAQPLAQLLQNAASLTTLSKPSTSNKKLRPEIIDVHRLKDIGAGQPASAFLSLNSLQLSIMLIFFFLYVVCNQQSGLPSESPICPNVGSLFYAIPLPRVPSDTQPKSSPYEPTPPFYTHDDFPFSSTPWQ